MSTTSLPITGPFPGAGSFPGLEYPADTTSEPAAVYHEDREVNGVMYRVYNAQFNGTGWSLVNPALRAYATAQQTDGSIQYLTNPETGGGDTFDEWAGSDNNSVYNAADYGLVPGGDATANYNALQAAINAIVETGGILFIPAGAYDIAGTLAATSTGSSAPAIIIAGAGGVTLTQQNAVSTFEISNFSSSSGFRFQDMSIAYASGQSGTVAIDVYSCQGVTCERVLFINCFTAFRTDSSGLQNGLIDCTVEYDAGDDDALAVNLNGVNDFVQLSQLSCAAGGAGCVGIKIGLNNDIFISDVSITGFNYGLTVRDAIRNAFITGVSIHASVVGVTVAPSSESPMPIANVCFTNCTFAYLAQEGVAGGSAVLIALGAETSNDAVAGIVFANCSAYGWPSAGIEIDGGQNILISGGQFSSNGQVASSVAAGIAVVGGTLITISGVDCSGVNGTLPAQPCGITIGSSVSQVTITGCNARYNSTHGIIVNGANNVLITDSNISGYGGFANAVDVVGTVTNLQVINCPGYNDTGATITYVLISGIPFSGASVRYYGPLVFYTSSGAASILGIAINGHPTHLISGSFSIAPGTNSSATITFSPLTQQPNFLLITL